MFHLFFKSRKQQKRKKNEKIHMDFEKLTNLFEIKERIRYLIIYCTIFLPIY